MRRDVPIICAVEFLDSEGIRQKHKSVRFTIQIDDDGSGQKAAERRAIEELGRSSEQALTDKVRSAVIDWATVARLLRVVGTKTEAGLIVFDSSTNQPDSTARSVKREANDESIGQQHERTLTLSEWVTSTRKALDGAPGEKPIGNSGKITLPVAGQLSDLTGPSTVTTALHPPSSEWLIKNELLERVERECPLSVRLEFTRLFSDDRLKTVRDLKLAFDWVAAEIKKLPDPPKAVEDADQPVDADEGQCVIGEEPDDSVPVETSAPTIAMRLFEWGCERLELDARKRGVSRTVFDWLVDEGELPDGLDPPSWLTERIYTTFSSYLTKARTAAGQSVYDRSSGVETRSVKHHSKLDRQAPDQ